MKRIRNSAGVRRRNLRVSQGGFGDGQARGGAHVVIPVRCSPGRICIFIVRNDHVIGVGAAGHENTHQRLVVSRNVELLILDHRVNQTELAQARYHRRSRQAAG